MAIIKIKPIKKRINSAINYITDKEKTENKEFGSYLNNALEYIENDYKTNGKYFVTGINCFPENANETMMNTKESYGKKDGILAYHIIHSYNEKEVTPELAHKIGVEFAEEVFGSRFEVVVATHTNTKHYHNHIIVNSVSFVDGKKYYDTHESYSILRNTSNSICKSYGLETMQEKRCKGSNLNYQNFYNNYLKKNSYQYIKNDIDVAISQAFSFEDFKDILKRMDYTVTMRYGKISLTEKNHKRPIRIERTLGENYSVDSIKKRILEENSIRVPFIEVYKLKRTSMNSKYLRSKKYKISRRKPQGLIALYYHYLFLLKVYSNSNSRKTNRISHYIKKESSKMNMYSKQAKFLSKYEINTIKDLEDFQREKEEKINIDLEAREKLWRLRKREDNNDKEMNMTEKISDLNYEIKILREEMKVLNSIKERVPIIKEQVREIQRTKDELNKSNQKFVWREK